MAAITLKVQSCDAPLEGGAKCARLPAHHGEHRAFLTRKAMRASLRKSSKPSLVKRTPKSQSKRSIAARLRWYAELKGADKAAYGRKLRAAGIALPAASRAKGTVA